MCLLHGFSSVKPSQNEAVTHQEAVAVEYVACVAASKQVRLTGQPLTRICCIHTSCPVILSTEELLYKVTQQRGYPKQVCLH